MDEVRYCSTCKYENKKITEEPCMICSPWCDKWVSCKPDIVKEDEKK